MDDSPLGIADEVKDIVPFRRRRESLFDLAASVGDVESLIEYGIVDILDVADRFGGESAAAETDDIDAAVADGIASAE